MLKNKRNLMAGAAALSAMVILLIAKSFLGARAIENTWQDIAIVQVIAFLLPSLLICFVSVAQKCTIAIPVRRVSARVLWLTVILSGAISLVAFWLNYLILTRFGIVQESSMAIASDTAFWTVILVNAIIPAIFEELLFRGIMQSALEEMGTAIAITVPALCFSLIHMDTGNIAGSFVIGLLCGYLTYSFHSVLPSILAHSICNGYYLLMNFLIENYRIFGLIPYFLLITIFIFLVLAYFSLGSLEKLMVKGKVTKFQKSNLSNFVIATLGSPGVVTVFLITIMMMAFKQ